MEIFISTKGKNTNSGLKEAPLKNIESARDHIRIFLSNVKKDRINTIGDIIVWIEPGVYNIKQTIEISKIDSGTEKHPIRYIAIKKNSVFITGGIDVDKSDLKLVSDESVKKRLLPEVREKLLEVDLSNLGISDCGTIGPRGFRRPYRPSWVEPFIDSKPLTVSQWPKKGEPWVPIGNIIDHGIDLEKEENDDKENYGAFTFKNDHPNRWKEANEIWISGFFHYGFADDTIKVKEIDFEKKIIYSAHQHMYGFYSGKPFQTWYALNLIEEIIEPGEYAIDFMNKRLYFYPPNDFSEQSNIVLTAMEEPLIAIEDASFISFENIVFECGRGMGAYIENGEEVKFIGCTFRNFGIMGICIGKGVSHNKLYTHDFTGNSISRDIGSWHEHIYANPAYNRDAGKNHAIIDCKVYNMGAGGISLGGGDRLTLESSRNLVENCHIYKCNRLDRTYRAPINIDGVGNIIRHCKIHDAPGSAIYLHGNNHLIELNEIFDVMNEGDDMGGLYYGRDPSEFGTIIRQNFWYNIGFSEKSHSTFCLYFDDAACGMEIINNIFIKAGKSGTIFIGGGSYHHIEGNIMLDCPIGIRLDNRLDNWAKNSLEKGGLFEKRLSLVKIEEDPYKSKYPELSKYWFDNPQIPKNTSIQNLFIGKGKKIIGKKKWCEYDDYETLKKNNQILDVSSRKINLDDFPKLKKKLGKLANIKFDKIGLQITKK